MFKINNVSGGQLGPFGHDTQVLIADGTSTEIADTLLYDFVDDQNLLVAIQQGQATITVGKTTYERGLAQSYLETIQVKNIKLIQQTNDLRDIIAVNRIAAGYTMYPTGAGDNIQANTYGNGDDVILTKDSPTKEFQFLNHFYVIGGRALFENCNMDHKIDSWLYAPACTAFTQVQGDYNKVAVIPGVLYKFQPVDAGTGSWGGDLAAKIGTTNILKATPVPTAGNNGWFDYDSAANTLTPNLSQQGGYDLYDQNINLFKFGNRLPASALNGNQLQYEATDVVGKLLYNAWKIKFTLSGWGEADTPKVGIVLITAAKKNL